MIPYKIRIKPYGGTDHINVRTDCCLSSRKARRSWLHASSVDLSFRYPDITGTGVRSCVFYAGGFQATLFTRERLARVSAAHNELREQRCKVVSSGTRGEWVEQELRSSIPTAVGQL